MNGIIFELEEKSKYTGKYMDEEISYNDASIDYMEEVRECDISSEIQNLLNDPCLGKVFDKGEVDDEIIYNGNAESIKADWVSVIRSEVDKMDVCKDMTPYGIIHAVEYGFCKYPYRFYIDSYSGYVAKCPITLIEWVQGLKPGTVIKIGNIYSYHF